MSKEATTCRRTTICLSGNQLEANSDSRKSLPVFQVGTPDSDYVVIKVSAIL